MKPDAELEGVLAGTRLTKSAVAIHDETHDAATAWFCYRRHKLNRASLI